jgi:tRNA(Arg) A34 adenosine deaminase TadA
MTKTELIEHMTKVWHVDPQTCATDMLYACEQVIREWERIAVYQTLKACPSCTGTTSTPGIVREYFGCFNEWHQVKAALDIMMSPQLVPTK